MFADTFTARIEFEGAELFATRCREWEDARTAHYSQPVRAQDVTLTDAPLLPFERARWHSADE